MTCMTICITQCAKNECTMYLCTCMHRLQNICMYMYIVYVQNMYMYIHVHTVLYAYMYVHVHVCKDYDILYYMHTCMYMYVHVCKDYDRSYTLIRL